MHDGVEAGQIVRTHIPNVSAEDFELLVVLPQVTALVEEGVESDDLVSRSLERGSGDRADVAVVTGDQHSHRAHTIGSAASGLEGSASAGTLASCSLAAGG